MSKSKNIARLNNIAAPPVYNNDPKTIELISDL